MASARGFNGNCGLSEVYYVDALKGEDAYSVEQAGIILKSRRAILTMTDAQSTPLAVDRLLAAGWKCLGKLPGNHETMIYKYSVYLWGSPEFTTEALQPKSSWWNRWRRG